VGVIRALGEAGIRPDIVCGTSIGALVGAACAAGELNRLERWLLGLKLADVVSLMDVGLSDGGMIKGERLMDFFRRHFGDRPIAELDIPFAAVATALHTGAEIWLREGSTIDAVRASLALPAVLTPVMREGMTLVDGGLVNPVPVSLARAMGADILIAVDLGSDILGRHLRADTRGLPSMLNVVASSINIMQVRISRSRMAGEPPDVIVAPRLAHLGLLDFHRAAEAIEEGRRAVAAVLPSLRALVGEA
jgi:NTE family protein